MWNSINKCWSIRWSSQCWMQATVKIFLFKFVINAEVVDKVVSV